PNIKIYYWPYPGTEQSIVPGLGLSINDGSGGVVGHLLKFFPIAYFVVFHATGNVALNVPHVHGGDGCADPNCEVRLDVDFRPTPPTSWPEAPGPQHSTLLLAELARFVRPRRPRRTG